MTSHTFQQHTQTFNLPSLKAIISNTHSLRTTQHDIFTTKPINPNPHTQQLNQPPALLFTQPQNHNTYNNPAISSNSYHFQYFQNPPYPHIHTMRMLLCNLRSPIFLNLPIIIQVYLPHRTLNPRISILHYLKHIFQSNKPLIPFFLLHFLIQLNILMESTIHTILKQFSLV